ncbi:membrane-associated phospholipid phosphatase [Rhizobium aquaticum]|uniref:Membrane-associated phospholipid phosphatase n=1 Tax=Rhizobium aquaticum TaxID=1549636 RepID=A0ABV2IUF2_9HYPH
MPQLLLGFTTIFWISILSLLPFTILSVDTNAWTAALAPGAISSGVLAVYARARGFERLRAPAEILLFHLLLLLPVAASAYIAMQLPFDLADDQLAAMDAALGFDWPKTIAFIDGRPWLAGLLNYAYTAFTPQLILSPLLLALGRNTAKAYKMLISYGAIVLLASVVATTVPAVGTFATTGLQPKNINIQYALDFVAPLHALKNGGIFAFRPFELAGIISFPSVHAAVAVLCAWAWWHNRLLRYPVLALNVLMAISAVPNGGHYLVDVIAGIAVAVWVILAVDRVEARLAAHPNLRLAKANLAEATSGNP